MYNAGVDNQVMPGQSPTGYPPPQQAGYPPPQQAGYPPPQAGYPAPQPAYHSQQTSNPTVVIQQQPQIQMVVKGRESWSTGLCSCFDDVNLCKCFRF